MPKLAYLKPVLPNLAGKTVLEIGCNNGFFCFEFARMGAQKITGVEVSGEFTRPALRMVLRRAPRTSKSC
jgi:predicted RNA methylase